MIRWSTICLVILAAKTIPVSGQADSSFRYLNRVEGIYSDFTVDNLDNIYLFAIAGRLKKIKPNGDSVAVYNDIRHYGIPSLADADNPLKILLLYKNYSTVIILDQLLDVRHTINLREVHMYSTSAVTSSYDNNIWLFDAEEYKLKKIDDNGKVLLESTDWRQLMDTVPQPDFIKETNGNVYLYDKEYGFCVFDYYGALKNQLHFKGWDHVGASGNILYGFGEGVLYTYKLNTLQMKAFPLPSFFAGSLAVKAMNGKVYVLKKDGLEIYLLK